MAGPLECATYTATHVARHHMAEDGGFELLHFRRHKTAEPSKYGPNGRFQLAVTA